MVWSLCAATSAARDGICATGSGERSLSLFNSREAKAFALCESDERFMLRLDVLFWLHMFRLGHCRGDHSGGFEFITLLICN